MTRFHAPPAAAGSVTSHSAAAAIRSHATTQRQRVHECIADNPGITREKLAEHLGMTQQSTTPRVRELLDAGLARVVDDKGRTVTGCKAERLMITAKPYNETPVERQLQRTLPGIGTAKSHNGQSKSAPSAVAPSSRVPLLDRVTAERTAAEATQAKADSDNELYRRLEATLGAELDALNDQQRIELQQGLSPAQREILKLLPKSKTMRFELLKLLDPSRFATKS